jgi:hypothetical protein
MDYNNGDMAAAPDEAVPAAPVINQVTEQNMRAAREQLGTLPKTQRIDAYLLSMGDAAMHRTVSEDSLDSKQTASKTQQADEKNESEFLLQLKQRLRKTTNNELPPHSPGDKQQPATDESGSKQPFSPAHTTTEQQAIPLWKNFRRTKTMEVPSAQQSSEQKDDTAQSDAESATKSELQDKIKALRHVAAAAAAAAPVESVARVRQLPTAANDTPKVVVKPRQQSLAANNGAVETPMRVSERVAAFSTLQRSHKTQSVLGLPTAAPPPQKPHAATTIAFMNGRSAIAPTRSHKVDNELLNKLTAVQLKRQPIDEQHQLTRAQSLRNIDEQTSNNHSNKTAIVKPVSTVDAKVNESPPSPNDDDVFLEQLYDKLDECVSTLRRMQCASSQSLIRLSDVLAQFHHLCDAYVQHVQPSSRFRFR